MGYTIQNRPNTSTIYLPSDKKTSSHLILFRLHQIDVCILWRPFLFFLFVSSSCTFLYTFLRSQELCKLKLVPQNLKSWKYFAKLVTFLNLIGEPNCHIRTMSRENERELTREMRRNWWSWTRSSVWAWLRAYICMSTNIDPLIKIAFRYSLSLARSQFGRKPRTLAPPHLSKL